MPRVKPNQRTQKKPQTCGNLHSDIDESNDLKRERGTYPDCRVPMRFVKGAAFLQPGWAAKTTIQDGESHIVSHSHKEKHGHLVQTNSSQLSIDSLFLTISPFFQKNILG